MMKILIILLVLLILYLLAIMPRMIKRPDYTPLMNWNYAHRGLHDNQTDAPENSMKAFQKAVENGYGIELDVQLSKDNIAVVFHDENVERVCGRKGKVRDYTYAELREFTLLSSQERIPKFESVLEMVDGKVPLIVEIKMHTSSTLVCEKANALLKNYQGVYCMESFHPLATLWYRKNRPDVVRGQLSSALNKEEGKWNIAYFLVQHLLTDFLVRPDFIAYCHTYKKELSRRICRKLFRCLSVAWTIRSEQELDDARKDFDLFIFEKFIPKNT